MVALNADSIPAELKSRRQWLLWRWESVADGRGGTRLTKPPFRPCGSPAATDDPNTWVTFEEAVEAHKTKGFSGIGFVLTSDNGFVGVDLDHVRDPTTGETQEWAQDIVNRLDSYTEISPSGTGLRIFVHGALPSEGQKKGDFECYESGQYLTVTGEHLEGTSWPQFPLFREHLAGSSLWEHLDRLDDQFRDYFQTCEAVLTKSAGEVGKKLRGFWR